MNVVFRPSTAPEPHLLGPWTAGHGNRGVETGAVSLFEQQRNDNKRSRTSLIPAFPKPPTPRPVDSRMQDSLQTGTGRRIVEDNLSQALAVHLAILRKDTGPESLYHLPISTAPGQHLLPGKIVGIDQRQAQIPQKPG